MSLYIYKFTTSNTTCDSVMHHLNTVHESLTCTIQHTTKKIQFQSTYFPQYTIISYETLHNPYMHNIKHKNKDFYQNSHELFILLTFLHQMGQNSELTGSAAMILIKAGLRLVQSLFTLLGSLFKVLRSKFMLNSSFLAILTVSKLFNH